MHIAGTFLLTLMIYGSISRSRSERFCSKYCLPGMKCWPSLAEFVAYGNSLDGKTASPLNTESNFSTVNIMKNTYVTRIPFGIVFAESVSDIQKTLLFAKKRNIRVSIQSSGHDYIGRSTGDGTLQLNLSRMKKVTINLNSTRNQAGEVTAESGNTWHRIYREVDAVNRVIVGGSAQTVGMGGYNMGGGHSPMSRKLGLAVDNLLEVKMVTVDGRVAIVNSDGTHFIHGDGRRTTVKDDLFWALRGGGGGTFGVVVSFTMKLHFAPSGFVGLLRTVAILTGGGKNNIGKDFLKHCGNVMTKAPNEWSGYFIIGTGPVPNIPSIEGTITVALLHFGNWSSPSRSYMESIEHYNPLWGQTYWTNYTSFMDYKKNNTDPIYYRNTLATTLVQEEHLDGLADLLSSKAYGLTREASFGCTLTNLGGKTKETQTPDVTSVNAALRTAVYSASCGTAWADPAKDDDILKVTTAFNRELQIYGAGVYLNEPAAIQDDWKTAFWGDAAKYNRLLAMKKKYDPTNFLQCLYCVGSDLGDAYGVMVSHNSTRH